MVSFFPGNNVDGNLTLGENMADHGGLSMALEAYTTWRRTNMDVRLPALPFDDMQLFFLGICVVTSIHTKINKMRQLGRWSPGCHFGQT